MLKMQTPKVRQILRQPIRWLRRNPNHEVLLEALYLEPHICEPLPLQPDLAVAHALAPRPVRRAACGCPRSRRPDVFEFQLLDPLCEQGLAVELDVGFLEAPVDVELAQLRVDEQVAAEGALLAARQRGEDGLPALADPVITAQHLRRDLGPVEQREGIHVVLDVPALLGAEDLVVDVDPAVEAFAVDELVGVLQALVGVHYVDAELGVGAAAAHQRNEAVLVRDIELDGRLRAVGEQGAGLAVGWVALPAIAHLGPGDAEGPGDKQTLEQGRRQAHARVRNVVLPRAGVALLGADELQLGGGLCGDVSQRARRLSGIPTASAIFWPGHSERVSSSQYVMSSSRSGRVMARGRKASSRAARAAAGVEQRRWGCASLSCRIDNGGATFYRGPHHPWATVQRHPDFDCDSDSSRTAVPTRCTAPPRSLCTGSCVLASWPCCFRT